MDKEYYLFSFDLSNRSNGEFESDIRKISPLAIKREREERKERKKEWLPANDSCDTA